MSMHIYMVKCILLVLMLTRLKTSLVKNSTKNLTESYFIYQILSRTTFFPSSYKHVTSLTINNHNRNVYEVLIHAFFGVKSIHLRIS